MYSLLHTWFSEHLNGYFDNIILLDFSSSRSMEVSAEKEENEDEDKNDNKTKKGKK